jgi:hypothetical protein
MDNQQQAVIPGKDIINSSDDAELRAWADRLNVTKVKLKAAINAVGPSAKAVEAYLDRKK